MKTSYHYKTEFGTLYLAEENHAIVEVGIKEQDETNPIDNKEYETPLINEAYHQLLEYFAGKRQHFGTERHTLSTKGVANTANHSIWRNKELFTSGKSHW